MRIEGLPSYTSGVGWFSGIVRACAVVAPILLTGAWLSATTAAPSAPTLVVETAAPRRAVAAPMLLDRRARRTVTVVESEPAAPPPKTHPCAGGARLEASAREVFSQPGGPQRVALTFDDGPSRENTPRVLRALRRADAHATFFVLGDRAERMPDLLDAVHEAGHEIGNHGFSHTSMRSLWKSQIRDEVCRTHRAVESATGRAPTLLRPPFGRYAPSAVPLVGGLGYDLVLWSVDANDWQKQEPAAMARSVVRAARPGSIILMHDREARSVDALPMILAGLKQRGFEVVTVSALLGASQAP